MEINGEKTIELDGFMINEDNALITDIFTMGDFKKITIHIEPSMLKFLIEENKFEIEDMCDISIM